MPRRCWFVSIIVLLAVTSTAYGGIRPSFDLDHSAWTADVIVVCSSGNEPGLFTVYESLRGRLLPGQRLYLPELVPEKDARPLSEYPSYSQSGLAENIPRLSPGERVILFLDGSGVSTDASGPATGWRPTGVFRDMKTSVLWLDGGSIWMFRQGNNPGPSLLIK